MYVLRKTGQVGLSGDDNRTKARAAMDWGFARDGRCALFVGAGATAVHVLTNRARFGRLQIRSMPQRLRSQGTVTRRPRRRPRSRLNGAHVGAAVEAQSLRLVMAFMVRNSPGRGRGGPAGGELRRSWRSGPAPEQRQALC